jgi:uncharacterized protein YbjT (DUF2867 family)
MNAVVGATGNTGRVVAEELLAGGRQVRAIGRSAERLAPLVDLGADAFVGDVSDSEVVATACDGVGGVYCMIPPRFDVDLRAWQTTCGKALAEGIRSAGVPYIVNLSSVGAQHRAGTGPIMGLREQEARLNELTEANVLHLRAGWFMDNLFMSLDGIRTMGALGLPFPGDVPIAMIATRDIGVVAARHLTAMDFEGHQTQELLGPREYTLEEAASIIGAAIGKPDLPYARIPDEVMEQALAGMGTHPATVATFMELYHGGAAGLLVPEKPRSAAGTTPTTLEAFAPAIAAALED